jgi:hypothetical protein
MSLQRREFIAGFGGAAAWPLAARAQQGNRVRRIGVLLAGDENDAVGKTNVSAFTQALAELGWTDGRNVRMDLRWGGDPTSSWQAGPWRQLPSSFQVGEGANATVQAPVAQSTPPRLRSAGLSARKTGRSR